MPLKLTHNGKTKFGKNHKNTFGLSYGLPANGGTCPGATCGAGGCLDTRDGLKRQTCYMAKITAIYKQVGVVLQNNTNMLVGKTYAEMVEVCRATVQQFIREAKGLLYFRLHYSGDFFSEDYAKAWATVMKEFPAVRFWGYTRSIDAVPHLVDVPNFSLYLSCDPVNYDKMLEIYEKYDKPNLALAWLGPAPPTPETRRWVKCPEITGKVENTDVAGACSKCRLCVDNYKIKLKNIQFPYH